MIYQLVECVHKILINKHNYILLAKVAFYHVFLHDISMDNYFDMKGKSLRM